jgi:3-phenylpropionate/trans-cinnamate dioxygenase ferredoxin subunit
MKQSLAELVSHLPIELQAGQSWAVLGPEAGEFEAKLRLAGVRPEAILPFSPAVPGVIIAGMLSTAGDSVTWLKQTIELLTEGATLLVIDWQADGPLEGEPVLERRFKRGKLCRLLREAGFGTVQVLQDHPHYYVVKAMKHPVPPVAYAGEFVTVATLAELSKNGMKLVEVFGQQLVIANTGREIVAFAQACPHAGSALDKGTMRGRHIFCPSHFYRWNVCTGEPVEPADEDILPTYPIRVDEAQGIVRVALSL